MNILDDIITYIRRIVKSPSNAVLSDNLIIDYINRFWTVDVSARVQLFDLKTIYEFECRAGIDKYNMPLYDIQTQPGAQDISFYPVYQGFEDPCYVNGIKVPFYTQRTAFWNLWPSYLQSLPNAATGDGTAVYTLNLPFSPAIPGSVDTTGVIATGVNADPIVGSTINTAIPQSSIQSGVFFTASAADGTSMVVADSGQFLDTNKLLGLLYTPGTNPGGYSAAGSYSATSNVVDYANGVAYVTFPQAVASGNEIRAQSYFYNQGIPRAVLFYNNVITIRPPPNIPYLVGLTCYLTPAAFLTTSAAIPFAYMSEYIARGAARKLLSDTGDVEQFAFYEPLFREQEIQVWKRSQRQFTSTRTNTIFSELTGQNPANNIGQGT